jgi:hypothetical protein
VHVRQPPGQVDPGDRAVRVAGKEAALARVLAVGDDILVAGEQAEVERRGVGRRFLVCQRPDLRLDPDEAIRNSVSGVTGSGFSTLVTPWLAKTSRPPCHAPTAAPATPSLSAVSLTNPASVPSEPGMTIPLPR